MPPFVRMLRGYSSWCHSTSAWLMTCTANGVQGQGPGGISVPQGGGRGHHCPGGLCPIQWAGQVGHSAGRSGAPFSGPVRCPIQRAGQVGHSVGRSGGPFSGPVRWAGSHRAWHGMAWCTSQPVWADSQDGQVTRRLASTVPQLLYGPLQPAGGL